MKETNRYLSLPFRSEKYKISEGWIYSKKEQEIHGKRNHFAIDFELPRGSEVLASAHGRAIASYHNFLLIDEETKQPRLLQSKPIGFGLGFFVQIFHPEVNRYTIYGHLERISEKIPFTKPRRLKDGKLIPLGHKLSPEKYSYYPKAVWVERGEVVGYIGDSGLTWGYNDYPKRPDPKKFPSWDEVHLHFEEFARDKRGKKVLQRDPYDIYRTYRFYSWPSHIRPLGLNHLWLNIEKGLTR